MGRRPRLDGIGQITSEPAAGPADRRPAPRGARPRHPLRSGCCGWTCGDGYDWRFLRATGSSPTAAARRAGDVNDDTSRFTRCRHSASTRLTPRGKGCGPPITLPLAHLCAVDLAPPGVVRPTTRTCRLSRSTDVSNAARAPAVGGQMRKLVVLLALFGVALLALPGGAAAAAQTTIDSGPPATTSSTAATFTFHSSGLRHTFRCSLDGAVFAACTTPKTYTGLAVGPHTFRVAGVNRKGVADPTPASHTWTIQAHVPPPPPPPGAVRERTGRRWRRADRPCRPGLRQRDRR